MFTGSNAELAFIKQGSDNIALLAFQANKEPIFLVISSGGLLKGFDTIPAMGGCKHLDIETTCNLENKLPYIRLDRVVETIFKLVDE